MIKVINATSDEMAIDGFMDWLKGDETSLLVKIDNSEELATRYPYSDALPNVDAIISMNVKDFTPQSKGTWDRNGFWFKDKNLFLTKSAYNMAKKYSNVVLCADVLMEMRKALLDKVWDMYSKLYPTLDDVKRLKISNSGVTDEYITREINMKWLNGNLKSDAKEIFVDEVLFSPTFHYFDENSAVFWLSGDKEGVLSGAMEGIKRFYELGEGPGNQFISLYHVSLQRAYMLSEKAKNFTPSANVIAAKEIGEAVSSYGKSHDGVKNLTIVCKNSAEETFTGKIPMSDLMSADVVYLRIHPTWKGMSFYNPGEKWCSGPTADQVISISYRKDVIYKKA